MCVDLMKKEHLKLEWLWRSDALEVAHMQLYKKHVSAKSLHFPVIQNHIKSTIILLNTRVVCCKLGEAKSLCFPFYTENQ